MGHHIIKVDPVTITVTGMNFLTYAKRYHAAAEVLRQNNSGEWFDPIPYHLLCQALESNLKAFIWFIDRLGRNKFRSKYGHDIEKLWQHAKEKGIHKYCAITPLRDETIALVGPLYKDRRFAYLDLDMSFEHIPILRRSPAVLPVLRRWNNQLVNSLRAPVTRAS